jgi:hypothetical protein
MTSDTISQIRRFMTNECQKFEVNYELKHTVLGLPATVVRPHDFTTISISTYNAFRGQRVFVQSSGDIEKLFIQDVRVGNCSCFQQNVPVPARPFQEGRGMNDAGEIEMGERMDLDVAAIGQQISVQVKNASDEPVTITGCIFGLELREILTPSTPIPNP